MGISKNLAGPLRAAFARTIVFSGVKRVPAAAFDDLLLPTSNVVPSGHGKQKKLLRWIDRDSHSITLSPSRLRYFFRSLELAKVATLQTHFRGRGGLIQNLAIEAEFLHHFFLCFSSFWPKSFRREKPDFLAARLLREKKLVRRRSFLFLASLVHTLSTTITIYHKLNVRTSRFFFLRPIQHAANSSRTTFFGDLLPESFPKSLQFHAFRPPIVDIA